MQSAHEAEREAYEPTNALLASIAQSWTPRADAIILPFPQRCD